MVTKAETYIIKETCKQFFEESNNLPLLKNLPSVYPDIKKVKVRHRSLNDPMLETFNNAFDHRIYERAVFCNGTSSFEPILDERVLDYDIFYIFPPDEYSFLYNPACSNFDESKLDNLDDSIITELLQMSYTNDSLLEGMEGGAQIILYDIPFFYSIRASSIEYDELIKYIS